MSYRSALAVALASVALVAWCPAPVAHAAPEAPAVVSTWEISFKHHAPERLVMTENGQTKTYWFIRYTVTNNSGRDILFTPEFQLVTDTGQVLTAVNDSAAFRKIKELYKNPLLDSPAQVLGRLRQGEDNAKESVAIFTDVDAEARVFRFLVSGLTGDTVSVKNPITGADVVLQKTLMLEYTVPGAAIGIEPHPQFKEKKWVLK